MRQNSHSLICTCLLIATLTLLTSCAGSGKYTENTFKAPPGAAPSISITESSANKDSAPSTSTSEGGTLPSGTDENQTTNTGATTSGESTSAVSSATTSSKTASTSKKTGSSQDKNKATVTFALLATEAPRESIHETVNSTSILPLEKLAQKMQETIDAQGLQNADFGIAFIDLNSGEFWGLNADQMYEAASTIKAAAAMYTYEKAALGVCDLTETMIVSNEDMEGSDGDVSAAGVGSTFTLEEILRASIVQSDNTANRMVFRFWQDRCPEKWLVLALDARFNLIYNGSKSMSARQGARLMQELYLNEQQIYGWEILKEQMLNTSYQAMVQSALPVPVSQKFGKLGSLHHDIGIAYAANPFAFALYTDNLETPETSIGALALAYYEAVTP